MTPDHLNLLPGETVQDSIEMFKHFANFRIAILWYFGPNGGLAFQRLRPRNNSTGQRLGIAGAAPGQIIADGLQLVGRRLGPGDAHVGSPSRRRTSSTGTKRPARQSARPTSIDWRT